MLSDLSVWTGRYIVPPVASIDSGTEKSILDFSIKGSSLKSPLLRAFGDQITESTEYLIYTLLKSVSYFTGQTEIFTVLLIVDEFFSVQLCGEILQVESATLSVAPADETLFNQVSLRLCINPDAVMQAQLPQPATTHPQLTFIFHNDPEEANIAGQLLYTSDYSTHQLQQLLDLWLRPVTSDLICGPKAAAPDSSLYARFRSQAQRKPDTLALKMGAVELSWATLAQRVESAALQLTTEVPRNHCVALAFPKSIELVIATLACNAAGVIAMPLVEDIPQQRLQYQLSDANCQYVLGQLNSPVEGVTERALPDATQVHTYTCNTPLQPLALDEINTLYYTSGSEGNPKGVMLPGRAFHRLVVDSDFFDIQPQDCFGYFANPAFDAAALEVWAAMLNGLPLVLFTRDTQLDLNRLDAQITATGVNNGFFTTGLFNRIADLHPALFRHFRQLFFGGEKASASALRAALAASPDTHFINGYGPTENGVYTCCQRVDQFHAERVEIAIGRPIAGTSIVLVDTQLEPVPIGATGQLVCLGDGLATGYINQPNLSAERFIQWRGQPAYLSGDLARLNEQGLVEYIGRMDAQIKLNGYRIEPGEIEAVLRQQPDVQRAYVRLDEQSRQLQAWLTPEQVDIDAARKSCQQLPAWMRPSSFITLDELPLNANGKVDHHHLRRLAQLSQQSHSLSLTQTTSVDRSIEQQLLLLYSEILQQPIHNPEASLFELGGNSLHMMSLMAQLRDRWQLQITLEVLASASSPRQVAKLIDLLNWHEHNTQACKQTAMSNQCEHSSTQVWEF